MFEFIAVFLIVFLFLNRNKRKKKPRGLDAELKGSATPEDIVRIVVQP
jgi:hypothetical protein